jgi:hypothetical protein
MPAIIDYLIDPLQVTVTPLMSAFSIAPRPLVTLQT